MKRFLKMKTILLGISCTLAFSCLKGFDSPTIDPFLEEEISREINPENDFTYDSDCGGAPMTFSQDEEEEISRYQTSSPQDDPFCEFHLAPASSFDAKETQRSAKYQEDTASNAEITCEISYQEKEMTEDMIKRERKRAIDRAYYARNKERKKAKVATYQETKKEEIKRDRKQQKAIYYARPEVKARIAAYKARPEVKTHTANYLASYKARPEVKAKKAAHRAAKRKRELEEVVKKI